MLVFYNVDDPAQDRLLVKRHADRRAPCFIDLMACYPDTSEHVEFSPDPHQTWPALFYPMLSPRLTGESGSSPRQLASRIQPSSHCENMLKVGTMEQNMYDRLRIWHGMAL